jgi:fatty acid desaturase
MKDLQEKIEQGYKRLAIVNTIIAVVLAIPTLCFSLTYMDWSFPIILAYQVLLCVAVLQSPKIVNKIWK